MRQKGRQQLTSLDDIRRQASDLEIEVAIDNENRLVMTKRGGGNPRFYSLQECDEPAVLREAQAWIERYKTFLQQLDRERK